MHRGHFFSFEGIEGAGKSTLIRAVTQGLEAQGRVVRCVREPGGTPAGDRIRALLLDPDVALTPRAELILFNASRAQLVEMVILPAVAGGEIVLCDRYADSTLAYQGAARGVEDHVVKGALELGTLGVWPERTFLVDLPPEVGLRRAQLRRGDAGDDRFEGEALAFHQRVRAGFLTLARLHPERFVTLQGEDAPEALALAVLEAISQVLRASDVTPAPSAPTGERRP